MGEVWLAEQHEPLRRTLAVKVIKRGLDTREVVRRFESERQTLAVMDHPCIAKVIEAGATRNGRPYFAMEYVEGEPILAYCDRRGLDLDQRLELFLKVCQGVQHAHQKAIIHRDLKPSNVLVVTQDGEPLPKIIDFGVAKATGPEVSDDTLQGELVGTLDYMSPEQADLSDINIDTRTDVYALGVLLYELLVGRRPLESAAMKEAGFLEVLRAIREDEPVRPSCRLDDLTDFERAVIVEARATTDAALRHGLRSDLDWIVLRALEKDRMRRYATVNEFAGDITRHLQDEPVTARPPSRAYRTSKFVRRHRRGVAAAATAAVLVLLGTAGTSIGLVRARQAERVARTEAATARQVSSFMENLFEISDPDRARGQTVTAREILATGAARIEEQLAGQPATQARMMNTIGRVYHKLGLYDEAEPQLTTALGLREAQRNSGGGLSEQELALNRVDLARLYIVQARYDEAAALLRQSLRSLGGEETEHRLELASVLDELAGVLGRQGRFAEAGPLNRQALEIRLADLGDDHPDVASSYNSQAVLAYYQNDWPLVETSFQRALAIRERTLDPTHPDVAQSLNNLGLFYQAQDRYDDAIPLLTRAAGVWEQTLGPDHVRLGLVLNNLGLAHYEQRDLQGAEPFLQRALSIRERALGAHHPDVAQTVYNLANLSRDRGQYAAAESLYRRVIRDRSSALGAEHADVGWTIKEMAKLHAVAGRPEQAVEEMGRALSILEAALGDGFPELADAYDDYADFLQQAGRTDEARQQRARAETMRTTPQPDRT